MPRAVVSRRSTGGSSAVRRWLWGGALGVALLTGSLSVSGSNRAITQATPPLPCARQIAQGTGEPPAQADVLQAIASAQVVYLAETHTDEADHAAQLAIVQALREQGDIAIALEMFQRPFQPALEAYLAGRLTEEALVAESEYDTRWGYDWEFYAPILRYAKANQIPLIALNTPAEVTRQVATAGLESLTGELLEYIPPVADINTDDQAYRDWISEIFSSHGGAGHSPELDNFFAAQVLWDETMADGIARQLAADPDRQVIVLVGEGHIAYDYGI
ncbi:MAG: ChaN family lipoprotein, partial [Phormidesmis sp.]